MLVITSTYLKRTQPLKFLLFHDPRFIREIAPSCNDIIKIQLVLCKLKYIHSKFIFRYYCTVRYKNYVDALILKLRGALLLALNIIKSYLHYISFNFYSIRKLFSNFRKHVNRKIITKVINE